MIASVLAGLLAGTAGAQDIAGAADYPLIPRYDGSEIGAHEVSSFDEYLLVDGRAQPGPAAGRLPWPAMR